MVDLADLKLDEFVMFAERGCPGRTDYVRSACAEVGFEPRYPVESILPRQYGISFPANLNKRYLIRVLAKRFIFDRSGEKFSSIDHLFSIDMK